MRFVLRSLSLAFIAAAAHAQVPVRYPEGSVHGFVELRTIAGALLAPGDLLQTVTDKGIESRMVFHFADTGTVFVETVRFTQDRVFRVQSYHLVQRGDVFPFAIDATLSESGDYVVHTTSKAKGAKEMTYTGKLDLPADAANGIVIVLAKNVSVRDRTRLHIVAFTPEPRVIELDLAPQAGGRIAIGGHPEDAIEFAIEPKLGALLHFFANISGKAPPNSHAWIDTTGAPAFVRFEGPMYLGEVWRLTLASPSISDKPRN